MIYLKKRSENYALKSKIFEARAIMRRAYIAGMRDALEKAAKVARKEYEKPEGTAESIESAIRSLIPKD